MKLKEEIMCPVCISTMALMVAGATSTGGLTGLVVKKVYPKNGAKKIVLQPNSKENALRARRPPVSACSTKNGAGDIFHTYSCYARGGEFLIGAYGYLDLVPKGRDEDALPFTMAWIRHHDRYGDD